MKREPMPYWPAVTDEALREPASLARALAAMGFTGAEPAGTRLAWDAIWPPVYTPWPAKSPHRPVAAANNRATRDAPVVACLSDRGLFLLDARIGEWTTPARVQRGDDLPSLGALMWGCRYGQAAHRIARAIGLTIPRRAHA